MAWVPYGDILIQHSTQFFLGWEHGGVIGLALLGLWLGHSVYYELT